MSGKYLKYLGDIDVGNKQLYLGIDWMVYMTEDNGLTHALKRHNLTWLL